MEISHILFAITSGAVGFYASKRLIESLPGIRPSSSVPKDSESDSIKSITIDSAAARAMLQKQGDGGNIRIKMDETKRKSLAVGNSNVIPAGWEDVMVAVAPTPQDPNPAPRVVRTEKLTGDFELKFYGSQLIVGDRILVNALTKKLHRLEIVSDQVYIDGVPQTLHPNDLEDLKRVIRDIKK